MKNLAFKLGLISALLLTTAQAAALSVPTDKAALDAGKKTYLSFCIYCHGEKGEGDGPASALNGVPLVDISNQAYMSLLSDQDLYDRIAYGKEKFPYIQMPGWASNLSPEQITQVIAYLRTLAVDKGPLKGLTPKEREKLFQSDPLEQGRVYYLKYCSSCHGEKGDGNGPIASKLMNKPANFNQADVAKKLTPEYVAQYVTDINEKRGRYMPVFDSFIKQHINEIVMYIKTLSR